MNILIVTEQYVIDDINGKFYSNNIVDIHVNRFRSLGDITLCAQISHIPTSNRQIDLKGITIVPIIKENTINKRYINRSHNRKTIKEEVEKADFIIVFCPSSVADLAIRYAKKQQKKYLIVVIACIWDALWNYSIKGKMIAPIRFLETKKSLISAPYAIYVTSSFLQKRYPCKGKTIGISNVALSTMSNEVLTQRLKRISQTNLSGPINLVTAAAVDVRYKRQEDVIRAIASLKNEYNLHYYLIGGGNQSYLRNLSHQLGVEEQIHFIGQIPHEQIFQLLTEMDIYVQPSVQEGLPRAVIEAMSIGLPVIGARTGGIPELLESQCICRRKSVSSIIAHLRWILNIDIMRQQSQRNYTEAIKYQQEYLEKKRASFLKEVKKEIESSL